MIKIRLVCQAEQLAFKFNCRQVRRQVSVTARLAWPGPESHESLTGVTQATQADTASVPARAGPVAQAQILA